MSSSKLSEEISQRLLDSPTKILIRDQDGERVATLQGLRDALNPLGYDVTTIDAQTWNTMYPEKASNINRICELEQRIADLQHELSSLIEKKDD